jgi:hypothetical protein
MKKVCFYFVVMVNAASRQSAEIANESRRSK